MVEQTEPLGRRRPIIVTVFCALGFIGFPFFAQQMSDPAVRQPVIDLYGDNYLKIEIPLQIGFLIAFIGCWFLKKWGAYLMAALTIVSGVFYGLTEPRLLIQWARFIFISLVMLTCLSSMT
ncbi:MAG: hypothetical protein ACI9QL_000765 [Candidatus Omnitrophota bacterium]